MDGIPIWSRPLTTNFFGLCQSALLTSRVAICMINSLGSVCEGKGLLATAFECWEKIYGSPARSWSAPLRYPQLSLRLLVGPHILVSFQTVFSNLAFVFCRRVQENCETICWKWFFPRFLPFIGARWVITPSRCSVRNEQNRSSRNYDLFRVSLRGGWAEEAVYRQFEIQIDQYSNKQCTFSWFYQARR